MGFQTTVERRDGRLVVVKSAASSDDCESLASEAAVLRAVLCPGVLQLVSFHPGDTASQLVTLHAGSMTLADYSPSSEAAVARMGAGIAAIVAELHRGGLCHGALSANHVIVGADHQPTLCSFGRSVPRGGQAVAADLAALRTLVAGLLERCPTTRRKMARKQRQALRAALAGAEARDGAAESFAASLAAVPGARMPGTAGSSSGPAGEPPVESPAHARGASSPGSGAGQGEETAPDARTWRDRVEPLPPAAPTSRPHWLRPAIGLLAGASLALLVLLWLAVLPRQRPTGSSRQLAPETAAPDAALPSNDPGVTTATTTTGTTPSRSVEPCVGKPALHACEASVEVVGRFVRSGETWFELDLAPRDQVLVGDWDCDGTNTVAVLRPSTGHVFAFHDWAAVDGSVEAPVAAHTTPGHLGSVVHRDRCDVLATVGDTGAPELVSLS